MFLRMGVKRPLEEENLPELSFEQPKQHDSNKKLILVTENVPSHPSDPIANSPGEAKSKLCELDSNETPVNGCVDGFIVDKELEASVPSSLVSTSCVDGFIVDKELEASMPSSLFTTSSSSRGEHVGDQDFPRYYNVPSCMDLAIPRPPPEHYEDPYVYLLNCPPRKEVPVGPDYQVEVPEWDPSASRKNLSVSNNFIEDELEKKLMGTCIISSPGSNGLSIDGYTVGRGRTDCNCPDTGSVRCVQHHVRESRERLRYTIGDETFLKLGFYEMGEEVARRWSEENEQLFHKVVISNPASLGRDFWKDLAFVFPNRTKKELVSYYFNVFMLRRRGVQNRSYLLRIDSDDDEDVKFARVHYSLSRESLMLEDGDDLQLMRGDFDQVCVGGDEDSDVESLNEQDMDAGWADGYGSEPEIVCGDKDSCKDNGTCDGDIAKKDGVDGDSNLRPGTCYGNVPKEDVPENNDETAQMSVSEREK